MTRWLAFAVLLTACAMSTTPPPTKEKATAMAHASGTFEVKLHPQTASAEAESATVGRMSINKQFAGDLVGSSKGEMLMVRTAVEGSAGYVAFERVTGTLAGRSGSFLLQHDGMMNRGAQQLSIVVVPDSGTGDLTGISGKMSIDIKEGKHFYAFDYALPAQ